FRLMERELRVIAGVGAPRPILAHKPIPILLLTPYAAADFVRRAREVGVMAYVAPGETRSFGSILKVVLARFEELESIRGEVSDLKEALKTRELWEQAKRDRMRRLKLSEADASRSIKRQSQTNGTSLEDSASAIVRTEGLLFKDVNVVRTLQSTLSAVHRGLRSSTRSPREDPR